MRRVSHLVRWAALGVSLVPAASAAGQAISRIEDIAAAPPGAGASYLTVFDGALYYRANKTPAAGGNDVELWRYDPAGGARVIAEIRPGPAGSDPADLVVHDGRLYFSASDGSTGIRLWQHAGAAGGFATSLAAGALTAPTLPQDMVSYGGNLYYRALRSGLGIELWKFDGATHAPFDLYPGNGSSYPQHFIEHGGLLYFNACGPVVGTELHRTNGTAIAPLTDIWAGNDGSSPENMVVWNDRIYFSAYEPGHGRELWRYKPSTNEANLKADIVPGPMSGNPYALTAFGDRLVFGADDGVHGSELWTFDGTTASMVVDLNTNVTPPGADPVHHANPSNLTVFGGKVYFAADDGFHGTELFCYDGTNVYLVADLYPGPYGSYPQELTIFDGQLVFSAQVPPAVPPSVPIEYAGIGIAGAAPAAHVAVFSVGGTGTPAVAHWAARDGDWADAANWASRTPPVATGSAVIDDGGTARILVGSHAVAALTVGRAYDGRLVVAKGASLDVAGTLGVAWDPAAAGTLEVAGGAVRARQITGLGHATITVTDGGRLDVDGAIVNDAASVLAGSGTLSAGGIVARDLTVGPVGTVVLRERLTPEASPGPKPSLSVVRSIDFLGSGAMGRLDLGVNALAITGPGDPETFADRLSAFVQLGSSGTMGIGSSADTRGGTLGVGLLRNTRDGVHPIYAEYGGALLDEHAYLVAWTILGDANLDMRVDAADYYAIDAGRALGLTHYWNGDFDHSRGVPDGSDYLVIDSAFIRGGGLPQPRVPQFLFDAAPMAAVPEPAGITAAALGLLLVGRRRVRASCR